MVSVRCLVTGASGFLGRALVPALSEAGFELTAQYHRGLAPAGVAGAEALRCALPEGLDRLSLNDVDVVYHLAGIAHQQADEQAYRRVNLDASVALAQRALDAGVRRFIFVSSVKAAQLSVNTVRSSTSATVGSETNAVSAVAIDYARSKALAEQQLHALCRDTAMQLVVVRPALIYAARSPGHLRWLRRWAELRLPELPVGGARSMIARDDLVRLLILLATAEIDSPMQLTVTDGERYSAARLHRAFVAALGRPPLVKRLPRWVWASAASALDFVRGEPQGTTWHRLAGDEIFESEGLDALGFSPRYRFESTLQDTGTAAP